MKQRKRLNFEPGKSVIEECFLINHPNSTSENEVQTENVKLDEENNQPALNTSDLSLKVGDFIVRKIYFQLCLRRCTLNCMLDVYSLLMTLYTCTS